MKRTDIVKKLSDEMIDKHGCQYVDKERMGNGWASFHIKVDTLNKKEREYVWKAINLLGKAGVTFDTGCGCGNIDMELDWSLKGAYVNVRPIVCSNYNCNKELAFGKKFKKSILWVRFKRCSDNYIFVKSFCNTDCWKNYVKHWKSNKKNGDIELLGHWIEKEESKDAKSN